MTWASGALGLLLTFLAAADPRSVTSAVVTPPSVERFVLANGLTVWLEPRPSSHFVAFRLRYRVGTRDDPSGRPGLAGLVSRLMSRKTVHVAEGAHDQLLAAAGSLDAGWRVTRDNTAFWMVLPPEQLALPLWLWSEQMGYFAPAVDDRLIAQQLSVMRNERLQKFENAPAGHQGELLNAELFPPGHPYRTGRLAEATDLTGLGTPEVRAFAEAHYTPEKAILVLSGNFDPAQARALIERYFGPLSRGKPTPPRPSLPAPSLAGETRLRVAAHVELPSVAMAWPTAPIYQPGDVELDLAAELLSGPQAGWLRWRLVDQMRIASRVYAHQFSNQLGSQFMIEATATRGHTADELVAAIDQTLREVQASVDASSWTSTVAGWVLGRMFDLDQNLARAGLYVECEERAVINQCIESSFWRYTTIESGAISASVSQQLPLQRRVVLEVIPDPTAPIAGVLRERVVRP